MDSDIKSSASIPIQIAKRSFIIYLIATFLVIVICLVFGWHSIENFGTGLIYGSVGIVIFGALIVTGNSAQLPIPDLNYFISTRRPHHEAITEHLRFRDRGLLFFLTTLMSGVLLFSTGLLIKKLFE